MNDNNTKSAEFKMDWYGIGQRIRERRKKSGLTQEELGTKAGINRAKGISTLESLPGPDTAPKETMTAENLARLALALGVSLDYLILGKREEKKHIPQNAPDWATLQPYGECIVNMLDYLYANIIVRDYSIIDGQIIPDDSKPLFLSKGIDKKNLTLRYLSIDIPIYHIGCKNIFTDLINMDKFYAFVDLICHAKKSPFWYIEWEEIREAKGQYFGYKLFDAPF